MKKEKNNLLKQTQQYSTEDITNWMKLLNVNNQISIEELQFIKRKRQSKPLNNDLNKVNF